MKRIFSVITVLMLCLSFASCSVDVSSFIEDDSKIPQTMDRDAFSLLLSELPLAVVSTEYVKKDIQVDSATPEMLRVVLKNNSEYDIKNAVISFVAWDANKLPVKIKSAEDYTDGAYVRQVSFDDINLVPGATFGEDYGYKIDENCHIASFEAIVLSFETFENQVWKNPYYNEWCELYEGTKITDSMSVIVNIEDGDIIDFGSANTTTGSGVTDEVPPSGTTTDSNPVPPTPGANGFTVLNFGDTVSLEFVELTINGASYSDELYPTDLNGEYLYLQDVEEEKFFYLSGALKNIGTEEYSAGEAKAEITFDGEHKYEAEVIVDQGQSFTGTNVKLLYSVKIYICASVPDEVIDTYETCSIRFAFDDNFNSQSGYGLEDFPHKYEVNVAK